MIYRVFSGLHAGFHLFGEFLPCLVKENVANSEGNHRGKECRHPPLQANYEQQGKNRPENAQSNQ